MLSRRELERAADALGAQLTGGHLDRVVQRDATTLELVATEPPRDGGGRVRRHLVVSCDPRHAHVGEAESFAPAPPAPLGFAQLLRARVSRAPITGVEMTSGERQLCLRLAGADGEHALVLQILGPRSNVYLLDATGNLLGSMRPLVDTRRDLAVGAPFTAPATPAPPAGEDRFAGASGEALLAAIETHYASLVREQAGELLARRLGRAFARERARLARRQQALARDLARMPPAEEQRRLGELLKSGLHQAHPGAESVTVRDFAADQDVVIPLDPQLGPAQNLEKLFADYQRSRRREEAAAEQAASLASQLAAVVALIERLDGLAGGVSLEPDALARLAARPDVARLLLRHPLPGEGPRPRAPRPSRKGDTPARLRPGRYRTSDDLEIWVGRSAEGNDHLTTRLARGNDLFLHVEASPGSHVVLRLAGRRDAPQESLLEAAELAVHFSEQRHASRAVLHVAPIKDVRKPSGAKPGLVQVMRGRSLALRRDATRLAKVLAARIDDGD